MTVQTDRDWIDRRASEWADAGLIDDAQRAAIVLHERGRQAALDAAPEPDRRLTVPAEVAVYLGSVLALTGGAVAVGNAWDGLSFPARLGLAIAIALVGLVAGRFLFDIGEAGTDRIAGFVVSLGIGGVALATGLLVDEIKPRAGAWLPLLIGSAVLIVSLAAWRNRDRPLQLATAIAGFGFAVVALVDLAGDNFWISGVVFIVAGAWLAIGGHRERIRPRFISLTGGAIGAYIGGFMLGDQNEHVGPAAALVIALVFIAYTVRAENTLLLVLGILGATIASGALLATTFNGVAAAAIIAAIGLVLVVVVITRSGRRAAPS